MAFYENPNFLRDWKAYFSNTAPGTVTDFGGVTATMGEGGQGFLSTVGNAGPTGEQTFPFTSSTDPASIASWAPPIYQTWNEQYGGATGGDTSGGGATGDLSTLSIPTDLASTSSSLSNTASAGLSGIDWSSQLAQSLLPSLISTGQALPGLADSIADTLQGRYSNLMRTGLGPGAFQGTLNDLANRGMINSTTGANTLSDLAGSIMQNIAQQGWTSQLAQQQAQMEVPGMLANLIDLARTTSNASQSGTASYSQTPIGWQLLAQLLTA